MYINSRYLPTNYLLITKGNIVTLGWRNLLDTTLTKGSKLKLPTVGQTDIMASRYIALSRTSSPNSYPSKIQ